MNSVARHQLDLSALTQANAAVKAEAMQRTSGGQTPLVW